MNWDLLRELPPRHYVRVRVELDEDGEEFLSAVLFEEPPDDGWPMAGNADRFDDKPCVGVSARTSEDLDRLLEGMIKRSVE